MIVNRKASHDYTFLDTYTCGIVLQGNEVKAIRDGKASLDGTYCYINNNEMWLKGSYVKNDVRNNYGGNYEEQRDRKLLLTKREIRKIKATIEQKGFTIIPYKVFESHGLLKCDIKVCKGKKDYDKREAIKERDVKREIDRTYKL